MAKRVVIKIGNIFCTKIDDRYKVYFQYICDDLSQLNSFVIRVFKTRYPIDYKIDLEEVVKGEVHFYSHVMLRQGVVDDVWSPPRNTPASPAVPVPPQGRRRSRTTGP